MQLTKKQIDKIVIAIGLLVLFSAPSIVYAHRLSVVSSSKYFWLVKQNSAKKNITIYQSKIDTVPDGLQKIATLNGELADNGIGAYGNELDIVYKNGNVQKIRLIKSKDKYSHSPKYDFQTAAPLMKSLKLRGFVNVKGVLWALVTSPQYESGKKDNSTTKHKPNNNSNSSKGKFNEAQLSRALGLPPAALPDLLKANNTKQESKSASDKEESSKLKTKKKKHKNILLRLSGGKWKQVRLPESWESKPKAQLVDTSLSGVKGGRREGDFPILLRQATAGDNSSLLLYKYKDNSRWESQEISLPDSGATTALFANKQLVIAQQVKPDNTSKQHSKISVNFYVIRSNKHTKVSKLSLDKIPADSQWTVAPVNLSIALIAASKDESKDASLGWFTSTNLQGQVTQKRTKLYEKPDKSQSIDTGEYITWFIIISMALFMIFVFWKRDLKYQKANLGNDIVLATLGKRAMSGFIDLVPVLLIICYIFRVGPIALFTRHWPGQEGVGDWQAMAGGVWVIGGFVIYTLGAELIFQRTLGKWIAGLWVTNLEGQKPTWWRVVLRCLLKALDLVAWILLLFPGLNPLRQRLGDMVAGTVVVMKKPK